MSEDQTLIRSSMKLHNSLHAKLFEQGVPRSEIALSSLYAAHNAVTALAGDKYDAIAFMQTQLRKMEQDMLRAEARGATEL